MSELGAKGAANAEHEHTFLAGGGSVGEIVSSMDWSASSLGPISG